MNTRGLSAKGAKGTSLDQLWRANIGVLWATGLNASLPPWTMEGGYEALFKRLEDPALRQKIASEVRTPSDKWENIYLAAGSADRVLLVGFRSEELKPLTGKTLAQVAKRRGKDPVETIMDLIVEDRSRRDCLLPDVGGKQQEGITSAMGVARI